MVDVSFSVTDFGLFTIRNYYETSLTKGPQDGAGANLKYKADMAVIKDNVIIQNASDMIHYAEKNLKTPAPSCYQSENVTLNRRIFFLRRQSEQGQALQDIYRGQGKQEHSQYYFNW